MNYELDFLPGKLVVKEVEYRDNNRKYFEAGDEVLLLNYTNEPYRIVYDVFKAINENNCIGAMHLGEFPTGLECVTCVMARHNYPLEKMSVPDYHAMFQSDHVRVASPSEIGGTWDGHLIFVTRPDISPAESAESRCLPPEVHSYHEWSGRPVAVWSHVRADESGVYARVCQAYRLHDVSR